MLTLMRTSPGDAFSGVGREVRTENVSVPSGCSGALMVGIVSTITEDGDGFVAGGMRGMNVPGGKDGERTRRYQPRLGRWIDHSKELVALSWGGHEREKSTALYDVPSRSQQSRPAS
jgi:hypothetical protein